MAKSRRYETIKKLNHDSRVGFVSSWLPWQHGHGTDKHSARCWRNVSPKTRWDGHIPLGNLICRNRWVCPHRRCVARRLLNGPISIQCRRCSSSGKSQRRLWPHQLRCKTIPDEYPHFPTWFVPLANLLANSIWFWSQFTTNFNQFSAPFQHHVAQFKRSIDPIFFPNRFAKSPDVKFPIFLANQSLS